MIIDMAKAVRVEDEIGRRGIKLIGRGECVGPCPVCGGRDRFSINTKKQVFNCRGCDIGGDVIALVRHLDGAGFGTAIKTLTSTERKTVTAPVVKPKSKEKAAREEENAARALKIWNDAEPIQNTLAEQYLKLRGLEPPLGDDVLRFHGQCPFGDAHHTCLIALYTDIVTNQPKAITRTAIDGSGIKIDRLALGPMMGGAIKLAPDEDVTGGLFIGEGLETVLAAMQFGFRPAWALGSAGAIKNFPVLAAIESLTILVDHDEPDRNGRQAGQAAALECARRWKNAGKEVHRLMPRQQGADIADLGRARSEP